MVYSKLIISELDGVQYTDYEGVARRTEHRLWERENWMRRGRRLWDICMVYSKLVIREFHGVQYTDYEGVARRTEHSLWERERVAWVDNTDNDIHICMVYSKLVIREFHRVQYTDHEVVAWSTKHRLCWLFSSSTVRRLWRRSMGINTDWKGDAWISKHR